MKSITIALVCFLAAFQQTESSLTPKHIENEKNTREPRPLTQQDPEMQPLFQAYSLPDGITVRTDRDSAIFTRKNPERSISGTAEVRTEVVAHDFSIEGEIEAEAGGWDHVTLRLVMQARRPSMAYGGRIISESLSEFFCGTPRQTRKFHRTIRFVGNLPRHPVELSLEVSSLFGFKRIELRNLRIERRDPLGEVAREGDVERAILDLGSDEPDTRDSAVALLRKRGESAIDLLKKAAASSNAQVSASANELLQSAEADRNDRIFIDMGERRKN